MKYAKSLFLAGQLIDSALGTEKDYKHLGMVCLACSEPVIHRCEHLRKTQDSSLFISASWVHRNKKDLILQEQCELRSKCQSLETILRENNKAKGQRLEILQKHIKKIYYAYDHILKLEHKNNADEINKIYQSREETIPSFVHGMQQLKLLEYFPKTKNKGFNSQSNTVFNCTQIVRYNLLANIDKISEKWRLEVATEAPHMSCTATAIERELYLQTVQIHQSDLIKGIHIETVEELIKFICKPSSYELLNYFICVVLQSFMIRDSIKKEIEPFEKEARKNLSANYGKAFTKLNQKTSELVLACCIMPSMLIRDFLMVDWVQAAFDFRNS